MWLALEGITMHKVLSLFYHQVLAISTYVAIIIAGTIGGIDGGYAGAAGSALVALTVCSLLVFGIRSALNICFGPRVARGAAYNPDYPPSLGQRAKGIFVYALCLVGLVVVSHDAYYYLNLHATAVNHNTGARLLQSIAREDTREDLTDGLASRQWQHAVIGARPTEWLMTQEVTKMNLANTELIASLGDEEAKDASVSRGSQRADSVVAVSQPNVWSSRKLSDSELHAYGRRLCRRCVDQADGYQAKGWLLRYMSPKFIRQKRVVSR